MRYHLLSLRLFHSFSIICRTCESTSGSFSWLRQSGCYCRKVCKYKCESDNSVPFVMLTRVFFMQSILGFTAVLLESVSWTLGEVLI